MTNNSCRYAVTDVTLCGARTITQRDRTIALSDFAMLRANPEVFYAQVVEDDKIIRQFARRAGAFLLPEIEA
jgi:hypothetical protein